MADIITRITPSSSSLGQVAPLTKERGKHGRGTFSKESPLKSKSALFSPKANVPRKETGKGHVLDIHV